MKYFSSRPCRDAGGTLVTGWDCACGFPCEALGGLKFIRPLRSHACWLLRFRCFALLGLCFDKTFGQCPGCPCQSAQLWFCMGLDGWETDTCKWRPCDFGVGRVQPCTNWTIRSCSMDCVSYSRTIEFHQQGIYTILAATRKTMHDQLCEVPSTL